MNQTTEGTEPVRPITIEFVEPASMRLHPLHKRHLPEPALDSPEWHAFVDAMSGAGPEGTPPIYATETGLIMDGGRRWKAARVLQWDGMGVIRRPDELAGAIMLESLLGQRHLTKGAKVYLAIGFMPEFVESAERRRLANLRQNRKTLEKALISPKHTERASGKGWEELSARLGVGTTLMDQAVKVRKLFLLAHKFEFQDGRERTLKGTF
jgi:hypothetical protein